MKTLGCTVEHKYAGLYCICDESMLNDPLWVFVDERQVKFN